MKKLLEMQQCSISGSEDRMPLEKKRNTEDNINVIEMTATLNVQHGYIIMEFKVISLFCYQNNFQLIIIIDFANEVLKGSFLHLSTLFIMHKSLSVKQFSLSSVNTG